MLSNLFPIFNFNILKRQSQRISSGFILIEAYSALVLALFVFLLFVGAFASWTTYSKDFQGQLRACLYAQAYIERLVAEKALRFEPHVYSLEHENYKLSLRLSQDKYIPKFAHVFISIEQIKQKEKKELKNEQAHIFYTGYYTE